MTLRSLLACLCACLVAALSAQEVKKPKTEFPPDGIATFKLRIKSIPTIQVKINGATLTLGVDTGCQGTGVLTPRGAAKCDVSEAFTVPSMGNSGRSENTYGYVEKMEAGGAVWRDFHISIMPLNGMELDGLIGADLLFEKPFYMDLTNKVMTLGKTPDTSAAHEIPCYSRGGHCGVNIQVEGQKIPMIVDSGASKSYLCSLKFTGKTTFKGYIPVATVRGVTLTRVETCQIKSLLIGGVPLTGVEFNRDQEHNLLGDDFLRAHPIAVDMASRRLWLFESQNTGKGRAAPETVAAPTELPATPKAVPANVPAK
ncbi:MAG: Aspartyl protease [Verrucomicrobiota bacterium]|jgi:predicted aspartyl protease